MPDDHPLVCRFGALGDMILLTPLLKQLYLRSGLPCDVIGIGGWNRLLFREMPYVRDVFTIDSRSAPYWLDRSQRELVQTLKQRQYRFVWIAETNDKSYNLLARAGITRANSINQLDLEAVQNEHYSAKWLRLGEASPAGFDFPQRKLEPDTELFVSDDELNECRQWLQSRGIDPAAPLVCVQAGSKRTTRRGKADRSSNTKYWPEQNWGSLIDAVKERLPGVQVLLCGVPTELDMCRAIEACCRDTEQVQAIADDLPLRRLLALLSMAHSCISVDTGPAHAAAALNCPLVVLFGQANPDRFRPLSRHSRVAVLSGQAADGENDQADINRITPRQVLSSWIEYLQY